MMIRTQLNEKLFTGNEGGVKFV